MGVDRSVGEVFGRFGREACGFPASGGVCCVGRLEFAGREMARLGSVESIGPRRRVESRERGRENRG